MDELRVRPMTLAEYGPFRARLIDSYGAEHVKAGNWTEQEAPAKAAKEVDGLLPDRVDTEGMLLLTAQTPDGAVAGIVWVALRHRDAPAGTAWIYDIEVEPEFRGRGFGRTLLAAAEREAAARGLTAIALNVFGPNQVARGLYESAGYEITTLQMRKELRQGS